MANLFYFSILGEQYYCVNQPQHLPYLGVSHHQSIFSITVVTVVVQPVPQRTCTVPQRTGPLPQRTGTVPQRTTVPNVPQRTGSLPPQNNFLFY